MHHDRKRSSTIPVLPGVKPGRSRRRLCRDPAVNVLASYLLTGPIERLAWLICLSSGVHHWMISTGRRDPRARATPIRNSKLYVAAIPTAATRFWPNVFSNSVNPDWVHTKMGGARRARRGGDETSNPDTAAATLLGHELIS